jgi:DNA-binding NtrC family response regulator
VNNTRSILIIDDEKGYRDFYRFVLEPLGYKVSSAVNGEEGLRMALENKYDLVLLDVHMPKMRGPEVLTEIKKSKPGQIVIIFSSSSDPSFSFESKAKELGAFECLYKPVDLEDMIKIMDRAMVSSGDRK